MTPKQKFQLAQDTQSIPNSVKTLLGVAADNIERTVPFELWDECVEILMQKLSKKADKGGQPISVFFTAELQAKISNVQASSRYVASVNAE